MFNFIKTTLQKLYTTVTSPLQKLFGRATVDDQTFTELERILIEADTGVTTSKALITTLKNKKIEAGADLKKALSAELLAILQKQSFISSQAPVTLLVGINGSGKTTCAGKLAYRYAQNKKKVLLVAADTFRAAAPEQLKAWAEKIKVDIFIGAANAEPASVVFQGCKKFIDEQYDHIIIDTAGRLQTKINLMHELAKIRRIINKQLPETPICTLLTIDSMLGQNSFEQAKLFHESTPLDGIILTKMDGTGKGGIAFAIEQTLQVPIAYISYGESLDAFMPFDAQQYVTTIVGQES